MKDRYVVENMSAQLHGCFSKADLQTLFAEPHPTGFARRVQSLLKQSTLRRFVRGWYVTKHFDIEVLSQRLNPGSYLSMGTILARHHLIGLRPDRGIVAIKSGPSRVYEGAGFRIEHLGIQPCLVRGWQQEGLVKRASAEKAVLDVLYFHLRGRRYAFDIYSDLQYDRLDRDRLESELDCYRNPKFVSFVRNLVF